MSKPLNPTTDEIAEATFNATVTNLAVNLLIFDNMLEQLSIARQSLINSQKFNADILKKLDELIQK